MLRYKVRGFLKIDKMQVRKTVNIKVNILLQLLNLRLYLYCSLYKCYSYTPP